MSSQKLLNAAMKATDHSVDIMIDSDSRVGWSQIALNLTSAHCQLRDIELHQEFHQGQPPGGLLPGEGPLNDGGNH